MTVESKSITVSVVITMAGEDEKRLTGLAKKNGKTLKQYLAEELELNFRLSAAGARLQENLKQVRATRMGSEKEKKVPRAKRHKGLSISAGLGETTVEDGRWGMEKKTTKKTVTLTFGAAQMKALEKQAADAGLSVETMLEMQICMASASREVMARYARKKLREPSVKKLSDIRLGTVFGDYGAQDDLCGMSGKEIKR